MSRKNHKRRRLMSSITVTDAHHLLFFRRLWIQGHYQRLLREHWYCKVDIPRNTLHKAIHTMFPSGIPVPDSITARRVYETLLYYEDKKIIRKSDSPAIRSGILAYIFRNEDLEVYNALKEQYDLINGYYNDKAPE